MSGRGAVVLLLPLLAGCLIVPTPWQDDGGRRRIDEDETAFVVPGRTTRREVLLRLGEPDLVAPDGSALLYYWATVPVTMLLALPGGAAFEIRTPHAILVEFDARGMVRAIDRRQPDPDDLLAPPAAVPGS